MEISERLLNDAGGWQVMKQARALHAMERVSAATWQEPLLGGRVREGDKEYSAGLRIASRTNIENLCSCRDSRQRGIICAHSVAVGLELLKPHVPGGSGAVAVATPATLPAPVAAAPSLPAFSEEEGESIELFVILPPSLVSAWEKGSIMVGAEVALAGKRLLLGALPKQKRFRCGDADLRAIVALREVAGGELPGMMLLPPGKFLALLPALADHPRVTFGKSVPVQVSGQGMRPPLRLDRREDGSLCLKTEMPEKAALLLTGAAQPWVLAGSVLQPIAPGLPAAYHDLLRREITLGAEQARNFLQREFPALRPCFICDEREDAALVGETADAEVPKPQFSLRLEGSLNYLFAWIDASQGERRWTLSSSAAPVSPVPTLLASSR